MSNITQTKIFMAYSRYMHSGDIPWYEVESAGWNMFDDVEKEEIRKTYKSMSNDQIEAIIG